MRILLDNCVNHRFARLFPGRDVVHVRQLGWSDLSNGRLLRAASEAGFNVLITVDKGMRQQQNLAALRMNVITLDAHSVILEEIVPFIEKIEITLRTLDASNEIGNDILLTLPKS